MERLLAMRTQIKSEQAKEAFNRAMAAFQAECPTIVKTKEVFTRDGRSAYKYAPIESIVAQVKEYLKKNGFSYTTQIDLTEKGVKATCKVTHEAGHSEENSMEVPLGSKTQIMSDSQVTAAASTFAKRYAFCNAFGILTGDEDNDGAKFDTSPVKEDTVPTVTYDDHESAPKTKAPTNTGTLAANTRAASDKPWQQKAKPTELQLKKQIKDLADDVVMVPLEGTEYKEWIESNTGLELTPSNFEEIVIRLKSMK